MGSILKRTAFYEVWNGVIRPWDWAIVNYEGFGTMVEPFNLFNTSSIHVGRDNTNWESELLRVDELQQVPSDLQFKILSGGGETPIHGGNLHPRVGR